MLDTQPAVVSMVEEPPRRTAAPDLTQVAGILVDRLEEAGVDLQNGPSLEEMKRLLVEMLRTAKARPQLSARGRASSR
ncbi:MAG: hypothetical protein ACT4QC_21125 [Planctomycetaceae bacterium]